MIRVWAKYVSKWPGYFKDENLLLLGRHSDLSQLSFLPFFFLGVCMWCMPVCIHVCGVYRCLCRCVEAGRGCKVSPSIAFCLILETGLSLIEPEFSLFFCKKQCSRVPAIFLCPGPLLISAELTTYTAMPVFICGCGNLNSGPHVCTVSALTY